MHRGSQRRSDREDIRLKKEAEISALFECRTPYLRALFEAHRYPWELLPEIAAYAEALVARGLDGFSEVADGVLAGEGCRIHESAVLIGPAVIGAGCELRPGAYLRGGVLIGEGCVIGNSCELKNCILLDGVQAPHYNYIGDSVLGNRAHLGAGAFCSNLKAGGGRVTVHGEREYETDLRKVGAFLGDGADIGCGCVLNPGTVVGRGSSAYPLLALRGVYPAGCIIKATGTAVQRTM